MERFKDSNNLIVFKGASPMDIAAWLDNGLEGLKPGTTKETKAWGMRRFKYGLDLLEGSLTYYDESDGKSSGSSFRYSHDLYGSEAIEHIIDHNMPAVCINVSQNTSRSFYG